MAPRSTVNKTSDGKKQLSLRSTMATARAKAKTKKGGEAEEVIVLSDSEVNSEEAVALDPDDTMFKPTVSKSKIATAKPSVKTRGANGISMKRKTLDVSGDLVAQDILQPTPTKSNRRVNTRESKRIKTTESTVSTIGKPDAIVESDQGSDRDNTLQRPDLGAQNKKDRVRLKNSQNKTSKSNNTVSKDEDIVNQSGGTDAMKTEAEDGEATKTSSKTSVSIKRGSDILAESGGKQKPSVVHKAVKAVPQSLIDDEAVTASDASDATGNTTDDEENEDITPAKMQQLRGGQVVRKEVIVSESDNSDRSEQSDVNMDEYDLEDGFIDDSEMLTADSDKNEFVEKLKASKRKSQEKVDGQGRLSKGKGKAPARESPDWDSSQFNEDGEDQKQAIKESLVTTPKGSKGTVLSSGASSSKSGRRTFKSLVEGVTKLPPQPDTPSPIKNKNPVNEYRVKKLPKTCEVFNTLLQDALLVPFYVGLPPLSLCVFTTWSDHRGPGQYQFSSWASQCPDMDVDMCLDIMNFVNFGRFINPSRASPMITTALKVSDDGLRSNLMIDGEPAVLISTMYSSVSYVHAPPTTGLRTKYISGVSHTQEWERQVSFIGMAFGQKTLHAQIFYDALSYSTRSGNRNQPTNHGFSAHPSPATSTRGGLNTSARDIALHTLDKIPIYDARNTLFDAERDWATLANILPPFVVEVPRGSFIAVGYTCNIYFSSDEWNLSPNVQFIVVLGTP